MRYRDAGLLLVLFIMLAAVTRLMAVEQMSASGESDDQAALELGQRVEAVRAAIQHPEAPGSLAAVVELGHDQRYYAMVRGWLAWQLQGDISILEASGDQPREHINARVNFIKEAIRAIDLE
jgi:hypothetical protein